MRSKLSCIIFDFDGVIADTDKGREESLRNVMKNMETADYTIITKSEIIGLSTKSYLRKKFPELSEENITEIIKKRHALYFAFLESYCLPFDGMKETITELSKRYDIALVTTNSEANAKVLLSHLGIFDCFTWVIGREQTEDNNLVKSYTKIPALIDKVTDECIVIEDSNYGVNAAKQAGYYCIRFDPERSFPVGAEDEKVSSYKELRERIANF